MAGWSSEGEYAGHLEAEVSANEDKTFHLEELSHGVESITDIDILVSLESVDFVVFGGHEERGDTEQLKVELVNKILLKDKHVVHKLYTEM